MFESTINPRLSETDALGHISNTVMPIWFETARQPIFKIVHPPQTIADWPLIVARIEIDYLGQVYPGQEVEIRTGLARVGTRSFTTYQEAWQNQQRVARGYAVHVYFDFQQNQSAPIPEAIVQQLTEHLLQDKASESQPEK